MPTSSIPLTSNSTAAAAPPSSTPMTANKNLATLAVHPKGYHEHDPQTGAVVPPISLSTTFAQPEPAKTLNGFEYSRSDNPTRKQFEEAIAVLEDGTYGLAFASGSAATATIIYSLGQDAHVLSVSDVYGGTNRFMNRVAAADFGVSVSMIDMDNINELQSAIRPNTKLIWIESPTNPTLRITDISAVCEHVRGTRPDMWIVVDNTFMTPVNQRPLQLGASIVVHSVTKYLNGHCDVVMGVAVTRDETIYKRLKFLQNSIGAVPSPFDCWLALRGLKTLFLRMQQHDRNAQAVAAFLATHSKVDRVFYPGLHSHPQHALAKKQQSGFGGMVSFTLRSNSPSDASTVAKSTRIFTLAESLGGVESLIELPAAMTHASVPPEQRARLGISDSFIRLSCGIEDYLDLVNDLDQALNKIC